jgi:hypothetical protein
MPGRGERGVACCAGRARVPDNVRICGVMPCLCRQVVYMGSMSVLFGDFFVKRYILHQPAYDMCGESVTHAHAHAQTATLAAMLWLERSG